jgi:hypothetical protein
MITLVVQIEVDVADKAAGLKYLEKLARSVEGYQFPVSFDGVPVDEDLDPLGS